MFATMEQTIRHRRLYAFYNSKVLNTLLVVGIVSLTQIGYMHSLLMPVICSTVSFTLFIGYALWLWIKKPKQIVINTWLSNQTIWFTLYFLIVSAMKEPSLWWYIVMLVMAIVLLFITMIRPRDKVFEI